MVPHRNSDVRHLVPKSFDEASQEFAFVAALIKECDTANAEVERLRGAAQAVIEAYMRGDELRTSLADLERVAGFRQQGGV